jgi:hypothetical protein
MLTDTAPAGFVHVPFDVNICTSVGVALPPEDAMVIAPLPFVMVTLLPAVSVAFVSPPAALPMRSSPFV